MAHIDTIDAQYKTESDTKYIIFYEAAKLFTEKGYYAVSMREIAEKSNVTKPTIYYYFGSKEDLYKSLIKLGMDEGFDSFKKIAEMDIPVKKKLVKFLKLRFQLSVEHPELSNFFLKVFSSVENLPFSAEIHCDAKSHRDISIKVIREAIDSGEFGPGVNPELAIDFIGAVTYHFIRKQLKTDKKILTDKLAEEIIELLFKGFNE